MNLLLEHRILMRLEKLVKLFVVRGPFIFGHTCDICTGRLDSSEGGFFQDIFRRGAVSPGALFTVPSGANTIAAHMALQKTAAITPSYRRESHSPLKNKESIS